MTNFTVQTEQDDTEIILTIEQSAIAEIDSITSTITVESSDQINNTLIIEAASITDFGCIVVEKFDTYNLEITNIDGISHYNLPDEIPMSHIVGNLHVSRIDGLDHYLDSYEFDCGTP
jgi:hypothetical protein